jgi:hypothetical protein
VCLETKDELAFAYFRVLGALPIPVVEQQFTEDRVSRLFHLLGGKSDALDTEKQVALADSGRIGMAGFRAYIYNYNHSPWAVHKVDCLKTTRMVISTTLHSSPHSLGE